MNRARHLIVAILLFFSCEYSNEEEVFKPSECTPGSVSFSQEIEPITQSNCAISGCHVAGGQFPPLETQQQVARFAAQVKARTSNGTMPPASSGKSLTAGEIEKIACWVDDGAPDN